MKKPSLPYLETRTRRTRAGTVTYWYYRRGKGKPVRLPEPSEAGFLAAYEAAGNGPGRVSRTSIGALVDQYLASEGFREKSARTQRDYYDVLMHIKDTAGRHDVSAITMPALIAAMERNRHRIRFANYLAQVYRILCRYAVKLGWLRANPLAEVELFKTPKGKRKAHIPWTDAAVEKWRAEAHPVALLAFELGVGTTQRPEDLTRIRWSAYDGAAVHVVQGKTEAFGEIPCTPELKAALDRTGKRGMTILTNRIGRPLTYPALSAMMYAERKRLGLLAYDLHALRYRGIMELAWAGATDEEIASYSLHTSMAMIKKYAGQARQIMRARDAARKRRERNGSRT